MSKSKPNPRLLVAKAYQEANWNIIHLDTQSPTHLIAHRDRTVHFVRCILSEDSELTENTGLSQNTFIANAMANWALPIFASVSASNDISTTGYTIKYEDVNILKNINISPKLKKLPNPTPIPLGPTKSLANPKPIPYDNMRKTPEKRATPQIVPVVKTDDLPQVEIKKHVPKGKSTSNSK
jgi:hypothetical protein